MRMTSYLCAFIVVAAMACAQQTKPKTQPAPAAPPEIQGQTMPLSAPHREGRIVTSTRLVSLFSGMERQLFGDIVKKNKAAITQMVNDDFAIWMPNENGDPLPVDDWLQAVTSTDYDLKAFRFTQMSAHDLSDVVIVKFVLDEDVTVKGKNVSGKYFVIDAWQKSGDSFKLADRYISRIGAMSQRTPAKPTGKE